MNKAVDNAFLNISTNVILLAVTTAVSLWMTPYLIGKLGLEVYGVVPLFISILGYLGLLTSVLSASVGRYVSLYYFKGEIEQANTYLSSGFWGVIALSAAVLLASGVLALGLDKVFNVPVGYEGQARWLFLLVVGASLIAALNSLYGRSCFIQHKFYWLDIFGVLSKFFQVAVIVLGFTYVSKSLAFVGWGAVATSLTALLMTATLDRFVMPELRIHYNRFNYRACKEMLGMGAGVSLNQFGSLLYLNSNLIVINILLGSTATGQYGPIVQWAVLIRTLAGMITRLFGPMVMELIAKEDFEALKHYLFTLIKFLGLILGLPICLVCGFSRPLLTLWLGEEFAGLDKLMILLVLGQIVPYSLGTIFAVFKGLNTLKLPGIVTIAAGVANIILSVILVKYTPLGIYGAGIATLITVFAKGVLFNVLYLAKIMKFNPSKIWMSLITGCTPAAVFTALVYWFSTAVSVNSVIWLMAYGTLFGVVYGVVVFRLLLNTSERKFALRVLKLDLLLPAGLVAAIVR